MYNKELSHRLPYTFISNEERGVLLAALLGDVAFFENLPREKFRDMPTDRYGCSPLILAIKSGHAEVVLLLLRRGADITARDHSGQGVLDYACISGNIDIVCALLRHLRNPQEAIAAAFDSAAAHGHIDILKKFLRVLKSPQEVIESGFLAACLSDNIESVRYLITRCEKATTCRDNEGNTALGLAAAAGNTDILLFLLSKGHSPLEVNHSGQNALFLALKYHRWLCARHLLSTTSHSELVNNVSRSGVSPLMLACYKADPNLVSIILGRTSQNLLNTTSADGQTPLIAAVFSGSEHIVEILANHPNINVNLINEQQVSALSFAQSKGLSAIADIITKAAEKDCSPRRMSP